MDFALASHLRLVVGRYMVKKRCSSSLKNGLCSGFAPAPVYGELGPYVVGWLDFCHDVAPSSSLCGLDWLRWLDPVFGVISRCLCVYTCIPIDGETCGVGRLQRLVGL